MLISKTLRLFLDGLGRREEYEHYLRHFQAKEGGCFAALAPDLASMEQSAELMVFDLNVLLKLELVPLVLLCGPKSSTMSICLDGHGDTLFLHRAGCSDKLLGEARAVVEQARQEGKVPVLAVPDGDVADVAARLVPALFRRVHVLRSQGGLRAVDGNRIGYHWLRGVNRYQPGVEEREVLIAAGRCLDDCPSLHFAVGSPLNLLEELFTVKGAGSVVRRGSAILHYTTMEGVHLDPLKQLLQSAFSRPILDMSFLDRVSDLYVEEHYRGAALLEPHAAGRYLTKFAVGMQARGEGLALEVWNALVADHPALFWRSRTGNAINAWYGRQADGRQSLGEWQVYWRGVDVKHISSIIDYATTRPEDFASSTDDA